MSAAFRLGKPFQDETIKLFSSIIDTKLPGYASGRPEQGLDEAPP